MKICFNLYPPVNKLIMLLLGALLMFTYMRSKAGNREICFKTATAICKTNNTGYAHNSTNQAKKTSVNFITNKKY